jgi:hypothetical protein
VYNNQEKLSMRGSDGDESFFFGRGVIRIADGGRKRVGEYGSSFLEGDAVLANVCFSLFLVPFEAE